MENYKILRVDYSPYCLHAQTPLNALAREISYNGALLRVYFQDDAVGYASIHPWAIFGDLPLSLQLQSLEKKSPTPFAANALYLARLDAVFRNSGKNALDGLSLPENHFTCVHLPSKQDLEKIIFQGFHKIKIKCGKDVLQEINFIKHNASFLNENRVQLRLDFNGTLSFEAAQSVLGALKEEQKVLDFIEDPMVFDRKKWISLCQQTSILLAVDQAMQEEYSSEIISMWSSLKGCGIIKPSRNLEGHKLFAQTKGTRVVFTSYMDHPLGQMAALLCAALYYAEHQESLEPCGFLTHGLFKKNDYSDRLEVRGTVLQPAEGLGIGFDDLLAQESWRPLL